MKNDTCVLAIDAGGTFFKSSMLRNDGRIIEDSQKKVPVDSHGSREGILMAYEEIVNKSFAYANENQYEIAGVGVSTPGPFDYENNMSFMKHKFESIYGIDLNKELKGRCKCLELLPIRFLHDAHAFLLGEYWNGAAKGFSNVAAAVIGTGIGFGIIKNGKLLKNDLGGPYISIYGKPWGEGILEDVVSRRGIINLYKQFSAGNCPNDIDVIDIAISAINDQDPNGLRAFGQVGRVLALGIRDVLKEHEIECLVFGGQISKSFSLMETELNDNLSDVGSLKKIVMGQNIQYSTQIGAGSMIFNR